MTDKDTGPKPWEIKRPTDKWEYADFKEYLFDASKRIPESLARLPKEIILDKPDGSTSIGTISNELLVATFADREKRERGRNGIITLDDKLIFTPATIGTNLHIRTVTQLKGREYHAEVENEETGVIEEKVYQKFEKSPISIHTHGVHDVPPSPRDFENILADEDEEVAFIVLTKTSRFLILKSSDTPEFPKEEVTPMLTQEKQGVKNSIPDLKKAFIGPIDYRIQDPQMQIQFVIETCKKYNLALYVGTNPTKNSYKRIEM